MNSIALFIMGKKGLACLETAIKTPFVTIKTVVFATDKNVEKDYVEEIISVCKKHSIPHYNRIKFTSSILDGVDYYIAISWRWIVRENISKLIVFHDSILPKYRGFNPLVSALINGDKKIGVTAIFANKEFDKGDIIDTKIVEITYPIKIIDAITTISECYQLLLQSVLQKIAANTIQAVPQNEEGATFSLWRDEEDYFLDWNLDAIVLERTINALGFPYGGARTRLNNDIIVITKAKAITDVKIENRTAGKLLFLKDNQPTIVCGQGLINIEEAHYLKNKEKVVFNKFRIRLK